MHLYSVALFKKLNQYAPDPFSVYLPDKAGTGQDRLRHLHRHGHRQGRRHGYPRCPGLIDTPASALLFFFSAVLLPPYPCFLLSETRKAGRFFGATLYPEQAFTLCIPEQRQRPRPLFLSYLFGMGRFFRAFTQTPTLVFINFLGKLTRLAMNQADPGKP